MLLAMRSLWLVVVALAACGKSKAECRTEAESFGKLLAAADLSPSFIQVDDTLHLVERTDLRPPEFHTAPIVYVTATKITYQGKLVNADDLVPLLAAAHAQVVDAIETGKVPRNHPPDPRHVYLVIDAATPWSQVVAAVDTAAKAELTAPMFVFGVPVTWKAPPRAPIDTELDKIVNDEDGANKATRFAEVTKRLVERCPSVVELFGQVASVEMDKTAYISTELPKALIDCGCKVDMPDFRATMWRLMVNPHPTRVLAMDPDAPATPIAAAGSKLWRDVAPRFAPDVRNAKLAVE